MSDTPDVVEMENSPETANYRKNRLMLWEKILATYKDYREDAKKAGASDEQARRGAGKHVRVEIRMLCSDILTRAPIEAIVKFLETTRDWVDESENLITDPKANAALVELITSSDPYRTWAKRIDVITKMVAEDNASWSGWVKSWTDEIGEAAGTAIKGAGEAAGGFGKMLGALTSGAAKLLEWGPTILVGASVLGVVTVVAVAARK
jgi:hypothetical protein